MTDKIIFNLFIFNCRETFTIFSGGMPSEKGSKSNCITVMVGKATTVLEMEHAVCDFITLCENPWPCGGFNFHILFFLIIYLLIMYIYL